MTRILFYLRLFEIAWQQIEAGQSEIQQGGNIFNVTHKFGQLKAHLFQFECVYKALRLLPNITFRS